MSIIRYRSWLLAWGLVLMVSLPAPAQLHPPHVESFIPPPVEGNLPIRWFEPPDLSEYGNGPAHNEGFFFQYERLYWTISPPNKDQVGDPDSPGNVYLVNGDVIARYNSVDTSWLRADATWGNRFDLGYSCDDHGWLVSILKLNDQDQIYQDVGGNMAFRDPDQLLLGYLMNPNNEFDPGTLYDRDVDRDGTFGRANAPQAPDPNNVDTDGDGVPDAVGPDDLDDLVPYAIIFDTITVFNVTKLSGVELMRTARYDGRNRRSLWELMYGARFLEVHDRFEVTGTQDPTDTNVNGLPDPMADFFISTRIDNNIVGPQIGLRWRYKQGRWTIGSEGRFLAGFNFQNAQQNGRFGTLSPGSPTSLDPLYQTAGLPRGVQPTTFTNNAHDEEFSPVGEFRLDAAFNVTQVIALRVGYSALVIGGIGRASERTDYVLPRFGIIDGHTQETIFTNGVNFGIEFNR